MHIYIIVCLMLINLGPSGKINTKINYFCNPAVISTDGIAVILGLMASLSFRLSEANGEIC